MQLARPRRPGGPRWPPPAGTPSERASVRCARNGFVVEASSRRRSAPRRPLAGEVGERGLALAQPEPQRARPAGRREGAGAADRDVERIVPHAAATTTASRAASTRSSRVGPRNRRSDGARRAGPSGRRDRRRERPRRGHASTSAATVAVGLRRQRDRDEQPATGQVRPGPARPAARRRSPRPVGSLPTSRSQAARSVRRTSSARSRSRQPSDLDGLVLERLVGLEEVLDLDQAVRPDLVEPLDVLLVGIADGDAQDLEVEALLVAHLEPADRARPDVAAGEGRLVDDQQGVGVVAVAGARALDEAVVEVVVDGARQDAVEPEDAASPRRTRTCCATRAGSRPRSRRPPGTGPGLFTRCSLAVMSASQAAPVRHRCAWCGSEPAPPSRCRGAPR